VDAEAHRLGIDPVEVVEVGAGSGSLLRPLLDALETPARAWAVEVSPAARERLAAAVPEAALVAGVDGLPRGLRGVIVANEVADNLPAAVAVRRSGVWRERLVGVSEGALAWAEGPARPEVASWADRFAGPVPEGGQVEVQLAAGEWLRALLGCLEAGAVVVFDYGDTGEGLAGRRADGTLRTYRGHHLGPDPLLEPGATDVTVDVDFGALSTAAQEAGTQVEVLTQAAFLERWGLGERLAALRQEEVDLARRGEEMERLKARSRLTDGRALLHPRGLGDFMVLVARK
jgi:SAM-dependent MidA family methyltransferase